jgi:hypothetical protein
MSGLLPVAEDGYIHYMASQILRVSEHRTASAPHNEPLVPAYRHLCSAPKEDLSSYPYYTCNISRYYTYLVVSIAPYMYTSASSILIRVP